MGVRRGASEFSGLSDFVEDSEHHHSGLRAAFLVKSPNGLDFDMQHWCTKVMKFTSYVRGP
jgi:hypothetical protein